MKLTLPEIRHDQAGFNALTQLYEQARNCSFETIEINMQSTTWLDADMCTALGVILCRLNNNGNQIQLNNIPSSTEEILARNGFLSHYGHKKIPDRWGTTIPYQRLDPKDERFFANYIENELMHRTEVPTMSLRVQKKFQESILEIFSNAVLHSHTELGIFSCGQFFPKRHRLNFSIADLGIGMRQNIKNLAGLDLSAEEAIIWATTDRNTTKQGQVPGGLGLKLLVEFIDMNEGCIQIVSDEGYWKREKGTIITDQLNQSFPGTLVNIEINTADSHTYKLSSEPATNIF